MQWVLAFHIVFVVMWFAGLFYLPRLFVYHTQATDEVSLKRFCTMERKLYYGIMIPAMILAIGFGLWMLSFDAQWFLNQAWMWWKLVCVSVLVVYQLYLGVLIKRFKAGRNKHSETFYRWFNEVPGVLLITIVILVVVQP